MLWSRLGPSSQKCDLVRTEHSSEALIECGDAIAFGTVRLVPNDTIGKVAPAGEHRDPGLGGRTFDFDRTNGYEAAEDVDDHRAGVSIRPLQHPHQLTQDDQPDSAEDLGVVLAELRNDAAHLHALADPDRVRVCGTSPNSGSSAYCTMPVVRAVAPRPTRISFCRCPAQRAIRPTPRHHTSRLSGLISRIRAICRGLRISRGRYQAMNTENTNGESTPPATTSFSPARSSASSVGK